MPDSPQRIEVHGTIGVGTGERPPEIPTTITTTHPPVTYEEPEDTRTLWERFWDWLLRRE